MVVRPCRRSRLISTPGRPILLTSDSDPLAVDPYAAVTVSSDSDPLAVDPDNAIQVN